MIPRVGFVLEQALGHVAYGMGLRETLGERRDLECVWLEIPFAEGLFGRVPVAGKNWTLRGSFRARRAIARAHAERPLDALFVHTQTVGVLSGDYMSRIPTLLSLDATPINYDELSAWYGDKVHNASVERAKLMVHKAVMRRARKVTAWSEWTKRSLVEDYGVSNSSVTVLHPGTRLSNFPNPATRGPRRPGPVRILFVGGDFVRKGGDMLLDVFRQSLRGLCELHLVTSAEIEPEEGVFVHRGVRPHSPTLLNLYAESDVFVLPTRGDCLAVVLGEAMASSLPIVTTRVGAHAEAVDDGQSGYVIESNDAKALADRLLTLARDPALRERMGKRSREIGEERFDMNKNANRIADILIELTARSPQARGAGGA